jgi:AcrR family transcriptional regulator
MVQIKVKRPRGRPRAYDPKVALDCARDAFWRAGFAGTSLDDLGAATGMNRPSLYGAFGDKRALYLQTLKEYGERSGEALRECLPGTRPLREELRGLYRSRLNVFQEGAGGRACGCFLLATALTEAGSDDELRALCGQALAELDKALLRRFRQARRAEELDAKVDVPARARLAGAMIHALAVRARAGETCKALEADIEAAVELLCQSSAKV